MKNVLTKKNDFLGLVDLGNQRAPKSNDLRQFHYVCWSGTKMFPYEHQCIYLVNHKSVNNLKDEKCFDEKNVILLGFAT